MKKQQKKREYIARSVIKEICAIHESIMDKAKKTVDQAIRCGELLTQAKSSLPHGAWLIWIEENLTFSRQTAERYMHCFDRRDDLKLLTLSNLHDAYKALLMDNSDKGDPICNKFTGDPENYTPAEFIDAARSVMGTIDLDPASNEFAQRIVAAKTFYDLKTDGLRQEWKGNVFLNPPYSHGEIDKFVNKLIMSHVSGAVPQAILLTNNNTDTNWFHEAARLSGLICFTKGRISFYKEEGPRTSPVNGQSFFYFGLKRKEFSNVFSNFGLIMEIVI